MELSNDSKPKKLIKKIGFDSWLKKLNQIASKKIIFIPELNQTLGIRNQVPTPYHLSFIPNSIHIPGCELNGP